MPDVPATAALNGAAEALRQSARSHKQAEARHRKQARLLMQQLDELRTECDRFGITLEIDRCAAAKQPAPAPTGAERTAQP